MSTNDDVSFTDAESRRIINGAFLEFKRAFWSGFWGEMGRSAVPFILGFVSGGAVGILAR